MYLNLVSHHLFKHKSDDRGRREKQRGERLVQKNKKQVKEKMETQMDASSLAVISRDGRGRQRCGSVPASTTTRREKQNRAKFGNLRKRGHEMMG